MKGNKTKNTDPGSLGFLSKAPGKAALFIAFVLVFAIKAEQRWHFPNIYLDSLAQAATFTNWTKGLGWVAFDEDLGVQGSMHRFPPLYPLCIGSINYLFRQWTISIRVLDLLSILFILLGLDAIFRRFLGRKWEWGTLVYLGVGLAPLQYATGSGLLALALLLWAIVYLLFYPNKGTKGLFLSVLLLGLSIWVRPAYLPFAGLIPLFFLWKKYFLREKISWLHGGTALSGLAIVCMGMLYWQSLGPNLMPRSGGLYPAHLLQTSPFLVKTLLFWSWPQEILLQNSSPLLFKVLKGLLGLVNLGLLVGLLVVMFQTRSGKEGRLAGISLGVIFLNVSFLLYLSLTQAPEHWIEGHPWTYLKEDRYFLPAMTLSLLWFFMLMKKKPLLKSFLGAISVLYFLAFFYLHGQIHFSSQNKPGFSGSYTFALEESLIFLRKSGFEAVSIHNDPHNYLLEAYQLYSAEDSVPVFSLVKKAELPPRSVPLLEVKNWVLVRGKVIPLKD